MFKLFIRIKLEGYVKRYLKRHPEVKLIIVVGSVGKTSTKSAIGTVLKQKFRVRVHEGNHNAELSAPLAILGIDYPENLRSIKTWVRIFASAKQRIKRPADVDVIVQEVGSDRIGQVPHFGTYARPDIAVVTAISPEHMEYFKTMDAVASEELSVVKYSNQVFLNLDDIDSKYTSDIDKGNVSTYGEADTADYRFIKSDFSIESGFSGEFRGKGTTESIHARLRVIGEHSISAAVAAGAVGVKLGMSQDEIKRGLDEIRAVNGRMSLLSGIRQSMLIDDSYNSSPLAVSWALDTLYSLDTPQKIAVLGSMNELGESSVDEHRKLGNLCDPTQLDIVITVGKEAQEYIASVAEEKGCKVKSFKTSPEAGEFLTEILKPGAIVLFKGSGESIFLEETIKKVLKNPDDAQKLVRQSSDWMSRKNKFFESNQK